MSLLFGPLVIGVTSNRYSIASVTLKPALQIKSAIFLAMPFDKLALSSVLNIVTANIRSISSVCFLFLHSLTTIFLISFFGSAAYLLLGASAYKPPT